MNHFFDIVKFGVGDWRLVSRASRRVVRGAAGLQSTYKTRGIAEAQREQRDREVFYRRVCGACGQTLPDSTRKFHASVAFCDCPEGTAEQVYHRRASLKPVLGASPITLPPGYVAVPSANLLASAQRLKEIERTLAELRDRGLVIPTLTICAAGDVAISLGALVERARYDGLAGYDEPAEVGAR
jgi:hypothetical protein